MERLRNTAKGLDIFFRILFWLIIALGVILTITTAAVCVAGSNGFAESLTDTQFTLNGVKLALGREIPASEFRTLWLLTAAQLFILAAIICYGVRTIRRMLAPMKAGDPFRETVSTDFRKLAWATVAFGVVSNVISFITGSLVTKQLAAAGQKSIEAAYECSLEFIVIAFVFFLLSYVFSYGAELQRLSDETL